MIPWVSVDEGGSCSLSTKVDTVWWGVLDINGREQSSPRLPANLKGVGVVSSWSRMQTLDVSLP